MTAASLTNVVLGCLTTLFILQIAYYCYQEGQKETYRAEWSRSKDECLCDSKANCYPRSADSSQCGECFSCISIATANRKTDAAMAFALSSDHTAMSKVLVLIASIHKFYPSTKILLYDRLEEKKSLLHQQLVSVRNVQVLPADIAMMYLAPNAHNSQKNIFFMLVSGFSRDGFVLLAQMHGIEEMISVTSANQDALSRHKSVLWLTEGLEFISKNLDEVLNKSSSSVTTIGREYTVVDKSSAFVSYFPGTRASTKNFTLLLLRDGAQSALQWIGKCAAEPQRRCWDCRDFADNLIDCLPGLLSRLSLDSRVQHSPLPINSVQHQRWEPPDCDARCVAYTFISIILFLLVAVSLVLLMYNSANSKSK